MQIGTVSGLRFCKRSWGLKIFFGWNIVGFGGSHTFVSISWMCKKQTSVSHSSTESENISLDAGLRLDGIPALDLWDLIVAVLLVALIESAKRATYSRQLQKYVWIQDLRRSKREKTILFWETWREHVLMVLEKTTPQKTRFRSVRIYKIFKGFTYRWKVNLWEH